MVRPALVISAAAIVAALGCGGRQSGESAGSICKDNGAVHANGTFWTCGCNSCSCDNGEIGRTLIGCPLGGPDGGGVDGSGGADDGMDGQSVADAISAQVACDDFLTVGVKSCGGMPTAAMALIRNGFGQACQNAIALPGSGVTPGTLEGCAASLNALPCQTAPTLVDAIWYGGAGFLAARCNFRGSLASGAPCNEDFQCVSGVCSGAHSTSCGVCAPTAAVGESCSSSGCGLGATCYAANNSPVCAAVTYGTLGANCDGSVSFCAPGLSCDMQTGQCVGIPKNVGDPCSASVGCAPPLLCGGTLTCQQPKSLAGACSADQDCPVGYVCEQMRAAGVCTAITWIMPGQPCGAYPAQCLVGSCDNIFARLPTPPLTDGGVPTCPFVVPNGGPCNGSGPNATCDTYSECLKGVCTPIDGNICP